MTTKSTMNVMIPVNNENLNRRYRIGIYGHRRRRRPYHNVVVVVVVVPFLLVWLMMICCNSSSFVSGAPASSNQRRQRQKSQQQQRRMDTSKSQFANPDDYYAILGLKKSCTPKQIKSSYRKLALQYHPDKVKDDVDKEDAEQKFIAISQAYSVLSDEKKRSIYDQYGKNGLEAFERGQDPSTAGFGGFGGGGGGNGQHTFHFNSGGGGGGANFGGFDAFKLFEEMFANGGGGGGGFGGGSQQFQFNSNGGGGFPGGGFSSGGFGGGGGGRRQSTPKPKDIFTKDTVGITKLGSPKFPDTSSKYFWLIVFYDSHDSTSNTEEAKSILDTIVSKTNKDSASTTFKIGAIDCSKNSVEREFCTKKNVNIQSLPQYAFVVNGIVNFYTDNVSAKELYTFCTDQIQANSDSLISNINHPKQLVDRMILNHVVQNDKKPSTTNDNVSFLLLTDKYETSPTYISIAYQFRKNSKIKFGISRAKNLKLAQMIGHVKKYPHFIALLPIVSGKQQQEDTTNNDDYVLSLGDEYNNEKVRIIRYTGSMKSTKDITNWINEILNQVPGHSSKRKSENKPSSNPREKRKSNNNNNNKKGYDRNEYGL